MRAAIYAKLDDEEPQPKRLCSEGIIGSYPNTDDQYPDSAGPQTREQFEQVFLITSFSYPSFNDPKFFGCTHALNA